MLLSRSDYHKSASLGFSLFELLVVIVIIGIVASTAVLAVGDFGAGYRETTAIAQFKNALTTAEVQAVADNMTFSVAVSTDGYRFYRGESEDNNTIHWQSCPQAICSFHHWPKHAQITLYVDNAGGNAQQASASRIIIDNSGSVEPFKLSVAFNTKYHFQIQRFDDGRMVIDKQASI